MFQTYDEFHQELTNLLQGIITDNYVECLDEAVEAIIESEDLDEVREYYINFGKTEEDFEDLTVELCEQLLETR